MDYEALFDQGTYQVEEGMSVFAGTTDDPFWIDLGAAFDTANFRTLGTGVPGVLTAAEDQAQANFASDTVSGYAVNAIAIEVPPQDFQMWVIQNGRPPIPSEVFKPSGDTTEVSFRLPIDVNQVAVLAVTIEPAGGKSRVDESRVS